MLKKSVISHPPTPSRGSTKLAEVQDATVTDQGRSEWDPAGSDRGQAQWRILICLTSASTLAPMMLEVFFSILLERFSIGHHLRDGCIRHPLKRQAGTVRITPAVLPNPRGREGGYS